jgi:hypothetical protein
MVCSFRISPPSSQYQREGLAYLSTVNQTVDKKLNVVRLRTLLRINLCNTDKLGVLRELRLPGTQELAKDWSLS